MKFDVEEQTTGLLSFVKFPVDRRSGGHLRAQIFQIRSNLRSLVKHGRRGAWIKIKFSRKEHVGKVIVGTEAPKI